MHGFPPAGNRENGLERTELASPIADAMYTRLMYVLRVGSYVALQLAP